VPGGAFLDSAQLGRLEEALRKATGDPCKVQVEFITEEAAAPVANGNVPGAAQAAAKQQRAELMQMPLVKRAVEVLGAQFIKADEGFGVPVSTSIGADSSEAED
jgi:hypothetical protein